MLEWLVEKFQYKSNTLQQGTSNKLCENLAPDADATCTKFDEHTGPCMHYAPSDYSEGQIVSVQWQTEDSANYKSYD